MADLVLDSFSVDKCDEVSVSAKDAARYEQVVRDSIVDTYGVWGADYLDNRGHSARLFGLPSPLLAVEFLTDRPDAKDVTSLRLDTRGSGLAHHLGVPVLTELAATLADHRIRDIGTLTSGGRQPPCEHHMSRDVFARHGILVRDFEPNRSTSEQVTWLNGMRREFGADRKGVQGRSLFGAFEYAKDRRFLLGVNAVLLSSVKRIERLDERFPDGFILLRQDGSLVGRFQPEPADTDGQMRYAQWHEKRVPLRQLIGTERAESLIVQGLRKVQMVRQGGRTHFEHRVLFFVYSYGRYRLVGGYRLLTRRGRPVRVETAAYVGAVLVEKN